MPVPTDVVHADELRRKGSLKWEEYGTLVQGKWAMAPGELLKLVATGVRDRQGRLRELEDLGGK